MDDFIRQAIEDDAAFLQRLEQCPTHTLDPVMAHERADAARRDVLRFAPHYCGSSIVFGSPDLHPGAVGFHSPTALAGRHLAPQKLSDGRPLHEALDSSFALICFVDEFSAGAAFSREAMMLGMPLTLIHAPNAVARASCGADLILLRPDNFVAWTSSDIVADPRRILAKAIGR
jgi:hypothetical protein